jgi:hypothetical protein
MITWVASSTRIGVTSFVLAFALLTGNPVAGALLTPERHWQRPLMFAAVSVNTLDAFIRRPK